MAFGQARGRTLDAVLGLVQLGQLADEGFLGKCGHLNEPSCNGDRPRQRRVGKLW